MSEDSLIQEWIAEGEAEDRQRERYRAVVADLLAAFPSGLDLPDIG